MNKNRQEYNKKILAILSEYVEKYPDMRFTQALWNLKLIDHEPIIDHKPLIIIDRYYEEPWVTLERIGK